MKADSQLVLAIIIFVVGFAIGVTTGITDISQISETVLVGFATITAAFGGAWLAYSLQWKRLELEERGKRTTAGKRALFVLRAYSTMLEVYRRDYIEPVRDHPDRHLLLDPVMEMMRAPIELDFDSICFLTDKDEEVLLHNLIAVQTSYRSMVAAINRRSDLHLEHQAAIDAANIEADTPFNAEQVRGIVGDRIDEYLRQSTEQIINKVDEVITDTHSVQDELMSVMKRLFPKAEFKKLVLRDDV